YVSLSWIYRDKLQPEQALAAAEQVITLQPGNADSYATQREILRTVGRPEEALRAIEKAMRLNPRPPGWYLLTFADNHRFLGYVYLWQQQYEPALAAMERAIALEPNEARGIAALNYAGLAEVLSRMGRAEEALGAAEQALRLKSLLVDAHLANVGSA